MTQLQSYTGQIGIGGNNTADELFRKVNLNFVQISKYNILYILNRLGWFTKPSYF